MNSYDTSNGNGSFLKPAIEEKRCLQCGQLENTARKYCLNCGLNYSAQGGTASKFTAPNTVSQTAITQRQMQALNMRGSLVSTQNKSYAGFWVRVGAYCIDSIVLAVGIGTISGFLSVTAGLSHIQPELAALLVYGFVLLGTWFYFAGMESSDFQATFGKMAFGLEVTDTEGRRLSFWRATGRYFGKILSAIPFNLGYIMVGMTDKKQGLHDILAGTLVVRK